MRTTFALLALVATTFANPRPQGVTQVITPTAVPPGGCSETRTGNFAITVVNTTSSNPPSEKALNAELQERQAAGVLEITLNNGVLMDQDGRTGYIASNYQFQFDKPAQHGAIYTAGFSICSNGTLALGGSAVFYQCLSGSFYNLYDRHWAAQCNPVYIEVIGGAGTIVTTSTPAPTPVTETTTTSSSSSSASAGIGGGSSSSTGALASKASGASGTASGQSGSSTSASGSGGSSASGSGSSASGTGSAASSSSSGAALPGATSGPQAIVAFAAGIFGAMAIL